MQNLKTMLLIKDVQHLRDKSTLPTFRLLPLTSECPYLACEMDVSNNVFVILCKEKKNDLEVIPAMSETGEPKRNKAGAQMLERRTIENYFELHINEPESIIAFIKNIAVNGEDSSIFMPYLSAIIPIKAKMEAPKSLILEA